MIAGSLTFMPDIYSLQMIIPVAHAEVKNYVATDTTMCDFGEDDPEIVKMIQAAAQSRAIQRAKEQAGVYIKSYTKTINSRSLRTAYQR